MYYDTSNNNTLEKTNAEKKLREMFPMFNMYGLIQSIRPEREKIVTLVNAAEQILICKI